MTFNMYTPKSEVARRRTQTNYIPDEPTKKSVIGNDRVRFVNGRLSVTDVGQKILLKYHL